MKRIKHGGQPKILVALIAMCSCMGCVVVKPSADHTLQVSRWIGSQTVTVLGGPSHVVHPTMQTVNTTTRRLASEGKPDVLLVAMCHMGDSTYYDRMQEILDDTDVILLENFDLGERNSAFWKAFELEVARRGLHWTGQYLADRFEFEAQGSRGWSPERAEVRHADWTAADVEAIFAGDAEDYVAFLTNARFLQPVKALESAPNPLRSKWISYTFGSLEVSTCNATRLANRGEATGGVAPHGTFVWFLWERNNVLWKALQQLIEEGDASITIAVPWGVAHQEDIAKRLERVYDYSVAEEYWIVVTTWPVEAK